MNHLFDLEERLLGFAAEIVRFTEALPRSRAGNHLASQLLRSGTAPLSHHAEAQAAESSRDFIHKMSIGLKELRETERWLKLVVAVPLSDTTDSARELQSEADELVRIFVASIATARKNAKQ